MSEKNKRYFIKAVVSEYIEAKDEDTAMDVFHAFLKGNAIIDDMWVEETLPSQEDK